MSGGVVRKILGWLNRGHLGQSVGFKKPTVVLGELLV